MNDGLRQRIATAVVLAPLAIAAVLWAPAPVFAAVIAGVALLGLWEWTRMVGVPTRATRALIVAAVGVIILAIWLAASPRLLVAAIVTGVLWWLLALVWLRFSSFGAERTTANCVLKTVIGALIVIAAWAALVHLRGVALGPWWTLYALGLVWAADIGAYFAGRAFGRRKLAPGISPGKTWAGVWGALGGASLLAVAAGAWGFGLDAGMLAALLILTLLSVVFSIVGDLIESLIKRHSNCKDSGTLLPGHGGVFDRIDSILAATPVFAAGKLLIGL